MSDEESWNRLKDSLDRHITGNFGEDSVPDFRCPQCNRVIHGEAFCNDCGEFIDVGLELAYLRQIKDKPEANEWQCTLCEITYSFVATMMLHLHESHGIGLEEMQQRQTSIASKVRRML